MQTLLEFHFASKAHFAFDERFYKKYKCSNNADVLKSYVIQIERSSYLDPYNLDLVFVGIDYDNRKRKNFARELNKLYEPLSEKAKQKAVIFFPVQAIEHWILFLQRKAQSPSLTKTLTEEIENIHRSDAKQKAYGNKPLDKNKLVTGLVEYCSTEWLCTQSTSFKEFYNRIEHVIGK